MRSQSTDPAVSQPAPTYSVVIPVYGNAGTLPRLLTALEAVAGQLPEAMEAVFVIDGSPDNSSELLQALAARSTLPIQVLGHSRNFGSFPAIRSGLAAARGEYIGVMAADLQEPPHLMLDFFRVLTAGEAEVVVGRRVGRADPAGTRLASSLFWSTYRRLVIPDLPPGGVDVFGVTRRVAQVLLSLNESSTSLVGQLYWVGFRRAQVPYERVARQEGRSGWTLRRRLKYLADSVFAFTDLPIRGLGVMGLSGSALILVISVIVFIGWATGRIAVLGYTPLMLVMLGCTFLMLFGLSVVGSYVWRIFENSQGRPVSIVAERRSFPSSPSPSADLPADLLRGPGETAPADGRDD